MILPASSGHRGKAETHFPRAGLSWWASLPLVWEPRPGQWVTRAGALGTGWGPPLRCPQTQGACGLGGYGGSSGSTWGSVSQENIHPGPSWLSIPLPGFDCYWPSLGEGSAGLPPPSTQQHLIRHRLRHLLGYELMSLYECVVRRVDGSMHTGERQVCTCMPGCAKHKYSHMCAWVQTHISLCTRCSHVQEHALVQLRSVSEGDRGPRPGRGVNCAQESI